MRQETVTRNIYKYSELSDDAKETARQNYAANHGYLHADEAFASMNALAEHFNGRIKNYEVDFFECSHSSMTFDMPDFDYLTEFENDAETEIKERLDTLGEYNPETLKGHGECKLTGVCHDEDAIDGFRKAWHDGERDLEKLMQAAFRNWLKVCQSDCAYFYGNDPEAGDEDFAEHCDANNYEFYEDGSFYRNK